MLEEALSSTTYSPAEAALTFISFLEVELAAGGPAAESRFFKLFSMLCVRAFGTTNQQEAYKHEIGGWLSRHVKWERPNTSLSSPRPSQNYRMPSRSSSNMNTSIRSDPVVKLLGARAITTSSSSKDQLHPLTLIEAFAKEAEHRPNVRYPFPFFALPKSTQEAWIALIAVSLGGSPASDDPPSENSTRLLGSLFRVKPLEQNNLRQYQAGKAQQKDANRRPLQLSPMAARFQTPQMSPMAATTTPSIPTPTKGKDTSPMISLSMLEYYLMVFIRYPLAAPTAQPPPPPSARSTAQSPRRIQMPVRRTEPYGDTVYYQLYQEYINYYVPSSLPHGHSTGFVPLQRPSELFVRMTIELWLEGQNQLWPTSKAIKALQDRRGLQVSSDLNASFDLVKHAQYDPPPSQITRCLQKLVARAVSDGAMMDMAQDVHGGFKGASPEVLCLTPTMTILQLPFYNYVRNTFRHASIHARFSPFYSALNDWLVWLEPWNTRHDKGSKIPTQRIRNAVSGGHANQPTPSSRVTYPKETQHSTYKDYWEPYIASNLYLYIVPLAIFLRRSRELDFSPREYQRSLNTVRRIFRVFSPEVVAVIQKLLQKKPGTTKYAAVVARHETNLGAFCPSKLEKGLASCQDDMQNLLEEIYLQHLKKLDGLDFVDRAIASIEGFFGGGAKTGEEKELQILFSKAKAIVGFPKEFEIMPSKSRIGADSQGRNLDMTAGVDRAQSGLLSKSGLEKVMTGATKCNPLEIGYVGDRMLSRPQTYEIVTLVPLLIKVSHFVNASLGLQTSSSLDDGGGFDMDESLIPRRFNFRFLADYRNLVFFWLIYWIWKLLFRG